jgi:hypothetical protein
MKKELKDKLHDITFAILSVAILLIVSFLAFIITEKEKNIVAFSTSDSEEIIFKNIEDFSGFKSKYDKYKEDLYYNSLDKNEKTIYHIYEYAFENCYTCIYFETNYNFEINFLQILNCLSFDSSLIETNNEIDTDDITILKKTIIGNLELPYEVIGIKIESFNKLNLNRKLEAVKIAEEIVSTCPENFGELEKAQYYLMYLSKNIAYGQGCKSGCYLYDAFVLKTGNCDAFSNAYSLLCNLSGIYCFEKCCHKETLDAEHVWNCIKICDKYYNVDCGLQSFFPETMVAFAFPECAQSGLHIFSSVVPECSEDLSNVICLEFSSINETDFITKVNIGVKEAQEKGKILLIIVENTEGVVETFEKHIEYKSIKTSLKNNGKMHYYIFT